jgi:type I restriction-modification system DNA methylase subunit
MEQHTVITGELKSKIDAIWNAFWSGGISNPMEVMEQLTYLLFLRRLDELHTLEENKANRLKQPMERQIFPEGLDPRGCNYNDYRWSRFKHLAPATMFEVIADHVFPFLKTIGSDDSTYSHHMRDARFTIPTPAFLAKVVDLLDGIPMDDRDTKGDVYEYMLGKIASEKAASLWRSASRSLIFFVVTFGMSSGNRWFQELKTYVFEGGSHRLYRSQPALPWDFAPSEYLERADGE